MKIYPASKLGKWVISLVVALGLNLPAIAQEKAQKVSQPNIIFIFADDWGWGDMSRHGSQYVKTPNLDRLAEEGTEFYQFSVANPVCSPSRAAVMTGHFPARHNVNRHFSGLAHHQNFNMGDWLAPSVVTMARVMHDAGYKTGHFGKWHLGNNGGAPLPTEYGYDEAMVFNGRGPQSTTFGAYDHAIDFIKRNKDGPFFVNLWVHETHLPHYAPPEALAKFAELDEQHRVYAAVVWDADQRIGRVLDTLDELGIADNTLVVFSSDNGPEHTGTEKEKIHTGDKEGGGVGLTPLGKFYSTGSSGGLRGGKRDTYEGGVRVPFFVRWPGHVPAGRVDTSSIVQAVDLLPTFAAAGSANLPKGYESDGQNVLDWFTGGSGNRTKPVFYEWQYGNNSGRPSMLAMRDGDWKLFVHRDTGKFELFNLMTDRNETQNIADQHPQIVAAMNTRVLAWKATLPDAPPADAVSPQRNKVKQGQAGKAKSKSSKRKPKREGASNEDD